MNSSPLVSVCITAYNHEHFIGEALESAINQETNFVYEVIVSDDKSSDKTAEVIERYEAKYPNLIKAYYQPVNLRSINKKNSAFVYSKARGKYIALCEGDDYWIDRNKLQKQVQFMEHHPECSLCFHAAQVINEQTGKKYIYKPDAIPQNGICESKDIILGGGGYIPTASVMYKAEILKEIPKWFLDLSAGDYALNVNAMSNGKAGYMDEILSVYRRHQGGIWAFKDKKFKFERMLTLTRELIPHFPQFENELTERLNRHIGNHLFKALEERNLSYFSRVFSELYYSNKMKSLYYFFDSLINKVKGKIKYESDR